MEPTDTAIPSPGERKGRLELILGPMFAGKSTEMLRQLRRHTWAGRRCVVIKPKADTRSGAATVATHDGDTAEAIECEKLLDVHELCWSHDVVLVDEGQFFPDIVGFCAKRVAAGDIVVVAALSGDFRMRAFAEIGTLIPLADDVGFHVAVCEGCGADAAFTRRKSQQSAQFMVGGATAYSATCRTCHALPSSSVPSSSSEEA